MFSFIDYTKKTTSQINCYKTKTLETAKKQSFIALMVYDKDKKNGNIL